MTAQDQKFVMETAALECSIQESIPFEKLVVKKSIRNDGSWVILNKDTKKVMFRKKF